MKCHHPQARVSTLLLLTLSVTSVQAADRFTTQALVAPSQQNRTLSPEQINAVRSIGRYILIAKKGEGDHAATSSAQVQLQQLRDGVQAMLDAELHPSPEDLGATNADQEALPSTRRPMRRRAAHEAALKTARLTIQQTDEQLSALDTDLAHEGAGRPAGMRMQRVQTLRQLANKIETAVNAQGESKLSRLLEIQRAMVAADHESLGLSSGPETPTLQAMPSTYAPQKSADSKERVMP